MGVQIPRLDENEDELRELLKDMMIKEDEELKRWHKMKRFEKIAKLRQEREKIRIQKYTKPRARKIKRLY